MAIKRRHFLMLAAGGLLPAPTPSWATLAESGRWLSCRRESSGQYSACWLTDAGDVTLTIPLPGRGHAIARHPRRAEMVIMARRPGTFMMVADLHASTPIKRIDSPPERHFYGHGVFDAEGRLLYATENDFATGAGVIGIYDAADGYRRLGEFSSHGVGPHELRLLGDGNTLVIANGGIRTHPDRGRALLNREDMRPNLAYVDRTSGQLQGAFGLPDTLHQLSIRHIDLTADDTVCIAMQYEGPANDRPPLVALHRGEPSLRLLTAPEPVQATMHNYCGSVAIDASDQVCAVTSPRGGLVTLWSIAEGDWLGSSPMADCCGVAAGDSAREFVVTNGAGTIVRLTGDTDRWTQTLLSTDTYSNWDNHLLMG